MKKKGMVWGIITLVLLGGVYYYLALPAINIHSVDVWYFVLFLVVAIGAIYALRKGIRRGEVRESRTLRGIITIFGVLLIIFIGGSVLSSPIVNAKKYQSLLTVEDGEFTKDIE